MKIEGKKYGIYEFSKYIGSLEKTLKIGGVTIHHTYSPRLDEWRGADSLNAIKRFYEREYGWPAGPHLFIDQDYIWEFTKLTKIGIHAGKLNATWTKNGKNGKNGKEKTGYWRPPDYQLKEYTIGIEVVGEYDTKKWPEKIRDNVRDASALILYKFGLGTDQISFHRDVSSKTCPGRMIKKSEFKELVEERLKNLKDASTILGIDEWRIKK